MGSNQDCSEASPNSSSPAEDADTYALTREEANRNRGGGWSVSLRRQGHKIVRSFKDSIYGSSQASFRQARNYRDAIISVLPPSTNHQQAVRLRRNNQSGISGVRRVEVESGDAWQATLMTNEGQKRETFPVADFGEETAKSLAITQRLRWLKGLPIKHLAYAQHAEQVTRQNFAEQLTPATDALPKAQMTDEQILASIAAIDARFDAYRPLRLRLRVKSYVPDRLSISISDAGQPAKRKLIQLNTAGLTTDAIIIMAKDQINATIETFYDADIACWFMEVHGNELLEPRSFETNQGFNILVFVPEIACSRMNDLHEGA